MTTFTKAYLVTTLLDDENLPVSNDDAKRSIEMLISIIKKALLEKKDVALLNYGRLSPRYKAGGRPVRNPKTNEPYTMPAIGTVTLGGKKADSVGRLNTSEIVDILSLELQNRELAVRTVDVFLETLIKTKSGEDRLEIRDFGVFHANWNAERTGRNPKTEESVFVKGKFRPHFKIGQNFKKQITKAFSEM